MTPSVRHPKTWRAFVEHLTVLRSDRFTETERTALVEALTFAAPQGPRGVECKDGCRTHVDPMMVSQTLEILERALASSTATPQERATLRLALADKSHNTGRRLFFPHVWKLIDRLTR